MEIIPKEWITEYLFWWLKDFEKSQKQPDRLLKKAKSDTVNLVEEDEESFVQRLSGLIMIFCGLMLLIPIALILYILKRYSIRVHVWYLKIYYWLFWNGSIRYVMESFEAITLLNLERIFIVGLAWYSPVHSFLSLLSILVLTVYVVIPLYMTFYFRKNVHKFG